MQIDIEGIKQSEISQRQTLYHFTDVWNITKIKTNEPNSDTEKPIIATGLGS